MMILFKNGYNILIDLIYYLIYIIYYFFYIIKKIEKIYVNKYLYISYNNYK